ncbi:MAG: phosphoesterase, PA-phosphatase related [Thermoleophilia bacterium]|nr:phosphoesterase, PA-phosphatase related [Thermoleophilia bacterium]
MPDLSSILSLLADYGYVIVFVGVLMESAGIPIPGETVLIAAGVLVQRHDLDLRTTIALGIAGAIAGDQIGYLVGRRGGRPFVLRWGRYVAITPERLERADEFFDRHGGPAVFAARFVPGLRVFGALMAGISRMRWSTFIVFNALGGIVWATAAVLAGVLAGSSYRLVEQWVGRVGMLVAGLVVLGLVGTVLARRHHRRRAR